MHMTGYDELFMKYNFAKGHTVMETELSDSHAA